MSGNTHMIVGFGVGYILSDMIGYGQFPIIPMAILGALLPDLDTKSKISCILKFQLPCKHRGFTHSILFTLICFIICSYFGILYSIGISAGILSHIICDMLTGGVLLMYPQKKTYKIKI